LSNLDDRLTMSVECSLPIFGLKVSVASRGLLVLVIQYRADQVQRGSIAHQPGSHGAPWRSSSSVDVKCRKSFLDGLHFLRDNAS
jgi:hypothetical protein